MSFQNLNTGEQQETQEKKKENISGKKEAFEIM